MYLHIIISRSYKLYAKTYKTWTIYLNLLKREGRN